VVPRRDLRGATPSVTQYQKRKLVSLQTFFEHYPRARLAHHFARQHLSCSSRSFLLGLDMTTLARRQAIGFHHHWSAESRERRFHSQANCKLRSGRLGPLPLHEFLGEALARLECAAALVDRTPAALAREFVDYSEL
jgi:hypothetical protein